ncbi:MAG: hypothetical protein GX061_06395 [Eubacteriaceae bacterium]|nr:hypothetical protein [Eubacteriaceae bacterium]
MVFCGASEINGDFKNRIDEDGQTRRLTGKATDGDTKRDNTGLKRYRNKETDNLSMV